MAQNILHRYAKAFYTHAQERSLCDTLIPQLAMVGDTIRDNKMLKDILHSPVIDAALKKNTLMAMSARLAIHRDVQNFLKILVDTHRITRLPDIVEMVRALIDRDAGIQNATFFVSHPLSSETIDRLRALIETDAKTKIRPQTVQDKSIIGGVVVHLQDKIYDFSVRSALGHLKTTILEER